MGGLVPEIASALPAVCKRTSGQTLLLLRRKRCVSVRPGRLQAVGRFCCAAWKPISASRRRLWILTHQGYQVHVAADAVSARSLEKHKLGMERMRDSAVLPCAAEAAVYELLREAGTPEFKAILKLVK